MKYVSQERTVSLARPIAGAQEETAVKVVAVTECVMRNFMRMISTVP
jgi:hypothetical protein